MGDKNRKALRSELKQIVKEIMPELLTSEVLKTILSESKQTLDLVVKRSEEMTERIEERHNNIVNLLMREFSRPAQPDVFKKQETSLTIDPSKLPDETI